MELTRLTLVALAAAAGSAINAIAGGGTLVTFPALIALGVPPIIANATSSVALLPGALGSVWGYRTVLAGAKAWAARFSVPSLLGGLGGAILLLLTPPDRFDVVVPWLVLGATLLFMGQRPITAMIKRRAAAAVPHEEPMGQRPPASVLGYQFVVALYGGYFGAGIGILMLAALGFMGFENIHRMNGLKNWGAFCIKVVAAAAFVVKGLVDWPVAIAMAFGATIGGYGASRLAQLVSQIAVRRAIVVIGLGSAVWLALR